MNERITESENDARTPLARLPDQPYTQAQDAQGRPMTGRETERFAGRGEPLTRTERLLVTTFVTMFATMVAAGALGFTTLSGQILDMQEQIGGLRVETHDEIGGLRAEIHDEIGGLRAEIHDEIGGLRAEMREEIGSLRAEMRDEIGSLRAEMREEIGELSERMTRIETLLETHLVPASDARDPAGP